VEPVELISFVMSQRMLRGIRERAERVPPIPPGMSRGRTIFTVRVLARLDFDLA
jgi:hypothetical protein